MLFVFVVDCVCRCLCVLLFVCDGGVDCVWCCRRVLLSFVFVADVD